MPHPAPPGCHMTYSKILAGVVVVLAITTPLAARENLQPAPSSDPQAANAPAPDSLSAGPVATLTALLNDHKLDAIAARDPDQPGHVVAALYFPGSQLLVVSAPYPVAALLDKRLAEGKYRDVYLDVQSPASHAGHFFVVDLLADGLRRVCDRDQPFDSTFTNGEKGVSFDGNWAAQQLTETAYNARFREDDARYARILAALAGAFVRSKTDPVALPKTAK